MIYSTLPNHGDIKQNLTTLFSNLSENVATNFLEIKSLNKELSLHILSDWLKREKRNLSPTQWDCLDALFTAENCLLYPLYIKLIFDIVVRWTSFEIPDAKFKDCKQIDDCIRYLFDYLESIHGRLLFSHAIIYMSSFKNGIE
jgi:hypothetical protein